MKHQDSVLVPQAHGGADRGLRPIPGPGPFVGSICEHQPCQLLPPCLTSYYLQQPNPYPAFGTPFSQAEVQP